MRCWYADKGMAFNLPNISASLGLQILNGLPDAVVVVDGDGHIAMFNPQAALMFRYARSEVVGKGVEILIPERFRSIHVAHRARYMDRLQIRAMGTQHMTLLGINKYGQEFNVEINLAPVIDETGGGTYVAAVIRKTSEILAQAARVLERKVVVQGDYNETTFTGNVNTEGDIVGGSKQ